MIVIHSEFACLPMIFLDDVNATRGTMEIGNATHRKTCE